MPWIGPEGQRQLRSAARVFGFGTEICAALLTGHFGGRWLDQRFGISPWFCALGWILGFAICGLRFVQLVRGMRSEINTTQSSNDPKTDR